MQQPCGRVFHWWLTGNSPTEDVCRRVGMAGLLLIWQGQLHQETADPL